MTIASLSNAKAAHDSKEDEKSIDIEVNNPFASINITIAHKIRNLEKKRVKSEMLCQSVKEGKVLTEGQKILASKESEISFAIGVLNELSNSIAALDKEWKREKALSMAQEKIKRELLLTGRILKVQRAMQAFNKLESESIPQNRKSLSDKELKMLKQLQQSLLDSSANHSIVDECFLKLAQESNERIPGISDFTYKQAFSTINKLVSNSKISNSSVNPMYATGYNLPCAKKQQTPKKSVTTCDKGASQVNRQNVVIKTSEKFSGQTPVFKNVPKVSSPIIPTTSVFNSKSTNVSQKSFGGVKVHSNMIPFDKNGCKQMQPNQTQQKSQVQQQKPQSKQAQQPKAVQPRQPQQQKPQPKAQVQQQKQPQQPKSVQQKPQSNQTQQPKVVQPRQPQPKAQVQQQKQPKSVQQKPQSKQTQQPKTVVQPRQPQPKAQVQQQKQPKPMQQKPQSKQTQQPKTVVQPRQPQQQKPQTKAQVQQQNPQSKQTQQPKTVVQPRQPQQQKPQPKAEVQQSKQQTPQRAGGMIAKSSGPKATTSGGKISGNQPSRK